MCMNVGCVGGVGERKVTLVPRPACLQALSMDALQLVATDHAVFNSSQKAAGRQVRRGGAGGDSRHSWLT